MHNLRRAIALGPVQPYMFDIGMHYAVHFKREISRINSTFRLPVVFKISVSLKENRIM